MLFLPWAAHVDGCGNSLTFPDAGVPAARFDQGHFTLWLRSRVGRISAA